MGDERVSQTSEIHLLESHRARVEEICAQEGVTLNEFVNVAVAEKLAHYRHMEWLKQRNTPTDAALAEVLRTLRKPESLPQDSSDGLPDGYIREESPEPVLAENC